MTNLFKQDAKLFLNICVVSFNSAQLESIEKQYSSIFEEAKKDFTRCNDIFYDQEPDEQGVYTIKVYAYSGIGEGTKFKVNFESKRFERVVLASAAQEANEESKEEEIESFSETELARFKKDDLKAMCRQRDATVGGKKADLISRILKWQQDQQNAANIDNEDAGFNPDDDYSPFADTSDPDKSDKDYDCILDDNLPDSRLARTDSDEGSSDDDSVGSMVSPEDAAKAAAATSIDEGRAMEQDYEVEEDEDGELELSDYASALQMREKNLDDPPNDDAFKPTNHVTGVTIVKMTPLGKIHGKKEKKKKEILIPLSTIVEEQEEDVAMAPWSPSTSVVSSIKDTAGELGEMTQQEMEDSQQELPSTPQTTNVMEDSQQSETVHSQQSQHSTLQHSPSTPQATNLLHQLESHQMSTPGESSVQSVSSVTSVVRGKNRTLKAAAVRMAAKYIGTSAMNKMYRGKRSDDYPEYSSMGAYTLPTRKRKRQGYARRPVRGDVPLYGVSYIGEYKEDTKDFFELERQQKSLKIGPADMHERVKNKYPRRFCIPTAHDFRNVISAYVSKKRKRGEQAGDENTEGNASEESEEEEEDGPSKRQQFPKHYAIQLEEWCRADHTLMPTPAHARLVENHKDADDLPGDKTIKSKVSQIRGKLKREMRRDLP